MKNVLLICLSFICFQGIGQNTSVLQFSETDFNFGKVKQNVPVTHVFKFTNTSNKPIVIEKAEAQCGCTKPEYPEAPIFKGKSGEIKVTYNAASLGSFHKQVTITIANQPDPIVIYVSGEVIAP